jgi:hypothetical protein
VVRMKVKTGVFLMASDIIPVLLIAQGCGLIEGVR